MGRLQYNFFSIRSISSLRDVFVQSQNLAHPPFKYLQTSRVRAYRGYTQIETE